MWRRNREYSLRLKTECSIPEVKNTQARGIRTKILNWLGTSGPPTNDRMLEAQKMTLTS